MDEDHEPFFTGYDLSRVLFETLLRYVDTLGPVQLKISKTQIALRRGKAFAWVWIPAMHLRRRSPKLAPLVLTFLYPQPHDSPRWKEIVQVSPNRFTHHLELWSAEDIDEEVRGWLCAAWDGAV